MKKKNISTNTQCQIVFETNSLNFPQCDYGELTSFPLPQRSTHNSRCHMCVCVFGTCVVIMAAGCQACQLLIYTNKHIHISAPMCFVHPPALIWPLSGMSFVVATAFAANFNINFAVDFPRTRHFLFNQCTFLRLFLYLLLLLS